MTTPARLDSIGESDQSVEARLRSIWKDVLSIQHVNDDDSFLSLGGDSISATFCQNRIRASFDVDVSMVRLMADSTTLRALAAEIARSLVTSAQPVSTGSCDS